MNILTSTNKHLWRKRHQPFLRWNLLPHNGVDIRLFLALSPQQSRNKSSYAFSTDKLKLCIASGPLGRLIPFLWPKNKHYRRRVVGALGSLVLGKLATIEAPLLLGRLIDIMTEQAQSLQVNSNFGDKSLVSILSITSDISMPLSLLSGYALARVATSGFNELRNAIFSKVSYSACNVVSCQTFSHLHRLDLDFILLAKSGELTIILSRGIRSITQLLNMMLFQVLPTILEFGLVLSLLTWKLGITSATMIAYITFTMRVTGRRTEYRKEMNRAEQRAVGVMTDSLTNAEAVRFFTNETFELERYKTFQNEFEMANVQVARSLAFLNFGQQTIFNLGLFGAMVATAVQISAGIVPVGHLAFVTSLLFQLAIPLNMIGSVYRETKLNLVDLEKLHHLLNLEPKCTSIRDAKKFEFRKGGGLIKFENVSFEYRSQYDILDELQLDSVRTKKPTKQEVVVPIFSGLDLEVQPGWKVGVVGPSGSGKTSLAKILYRLYDPQSGRVTFDGQDLKVLDLQSFRKHIGIVPQDVVLFNDTILYNLKYAKPDATLGQVHEAAKAAQLYDGFDTLVGERGLKLSGGEKQRVGIARCLLRNPEIVVLDEATSSLDSATEHRILKAFKAMITGRTSIVIAHRLSTIIDSDRIYVLNQGRVEEFGTHRELLQLPNGRYAQLWRRQVQLWRRHGRTTSSTG